MTMKDMGKKVITAVKSGYKKSKFLALVPISAGIVAFSSQGMFAQSLENSSDVKNKIENKVETSVNGIQKGRVTIEQARKIADSLATENAKSLNTVDLDRPEFKQLVRQKTLDLLDDETKALYLSQDSLEAQKRDYNKTRLPSVLANAYTYQTSVGSNEYMSLGQM